jgi:hypothetical protein
LRSEWGGVIHDTVVELRIEWRSEIHDSIISLLTNQLSCDSIKVCVSEQISDSLAGIRTQFISIIHDTADVLRGEWRGAIHDTADVLRSEWQVISMTRRMYYAVSGKVIFMILSLSLRDTLLSASPRHGVELSE